MSPHQAFVCLYMRLLHERHSFLQGLKVDFLVLAGHTGFMSKQTQNTGCLMGWLSNLFGNDGEASKTELAPPSIMVSKQFFTAAEKSFYRVMQQCIGDDKVIFVQVSLQQLFFLKGKSQPTWRNKMRARSVDFLLCDSQSLVPLLGIELDDASHEAACRVKRDTEVDQLFEAAGLGLLHVQAARQYDPRDLAKQIQASIGQQNKVR